ncbi:cardiolipin synthase [Halovenus aranensis]|jgi:phosphatidylglycerophosphate synthase|uniref:Cardiolipin synthase n=1 Tax=Halovenus aranensis TaxID=890420 RepID=A0A1G8RST7_9EURY|nr:CDP-alcohol phosphatidyltransferase family protein [Halovenus aranensis]SDJ20006.1 cardiolipin synthase [Halovenus aranensis]
MGIDWRERSEEIWTVPNLVTVARLPLFLLLVATLNTLWQYPVFALIVVTDGLDGWLARRLDQATELGAVLDPAFDKLIALLLVAVLFPRTDLAVEYLALFFLRDGFILLLGLSTPLLAMESEDIKASFFGKAVTNVQFVSMVAMLVSHTAATQVSMFLVGFLSAVAVADYVVYAGRVMTVRGFFESRRAAVGVYVVVFLLFGLLVRLLLVTQLRSTLDLFL